MIARRFIAHATLPNARAYAAFFENELVPKLRTIAGHRGALVLTEPQDETVRITVLTFWESMDAVACFASSTPGRAVVEPEARRLFRTFEERVDHLDVVVDTR